MEINVTQFQNMVRAHCLLRFNFISFDDEEIKFNGTLRTSNQLYIWTWKQSHDQRNFNRS